MPDDVDLTDESLMLRILDQDSRALGCLYDRYAIRVFGIGMKMLRDSHDAEDLVAETFIALWERAERYDDRRGSVGTFLSLVARSRARDQIRKRERRRQREGTQVDIDDLFEDPTSNLRSTPGATPDQLWDALERLDVAEREAIQLNFVLGLSHAEIATRLDEPVGTIKTRIRRGIRRLRAMMEPSFETAASSVADSSRAARSNALLGDVKGQMRSSAKRFHADVTDDANWRS